MKALLTLSLVFAFQLSFGQSQDDSLSLEHHSVVNNILAKQLTGLAAMKTTSSERLVAESYYSYGPPLTVDSLAFSYSGSRDSRFDLNYMQYRNFHPVDENVAITPELGLPQTYNRLDVLADSMQYYALNAQNWIHRRTYAFGYDMSDNIIDYGNFNKNGISSSMKFSFHYDNLARVDSVIFYNDITGQFLRASTRSILYDNLGRIIQDSTIRPPNGTAAYKHAYTYDVNGNITSFTRYNLNGDGTIASTYLTYGFTYYPNNLLQMVTLTSQSLGKKADSFGYTAGINFWTYRKSGNYTAGVWSNVMEKTKHLNAQNLPDTIFSIGMHPRDYYVYNQNGNPIKHVRYAPTGFVIQDHFYYYGPITSISPDPVAEELDIFPNPAKGNLLNIGCGQAVNVATLTLMDALGRVVLTKTIAPSNAQSNQLDISDLHPGVIGLLRWISMETD